MFHVAVDVGRHFFPARQRANTGAALRFPLTKTHERGPAKWASAAAVMCWHSDPVSPVPCKCSGVVGVAAS